MISINFLTIYLGNFNLFFEFVLILSNKFLIYVCVSFVRIGADLIEKFASVYFFSKKVLQNSLGVRYLKVKKTERDENTPFFSTQHALGV